MSTVMLDTEDRAEAEAVLGATYSTLIISQDQPGAAHRTRLVRNAIGSMAIDDIRLGFGFEYESQPPERIQLTRVHAGTAKVRQPHHDDHVFRPGDVAAFGAIEGLPLIGSDHGTAQHYSTLSIDREVLSLVAAGPTARATHPVRLTGTAVVSAAAGRHLAKLIDYVCTSVSVDAFAARSPLIASAVQHHLAAGMLAAFPNTAVFDATSEDRRDATPTMLRRAVAFIDENAHRSIALVDIAAAVYVTPRALQYAFRKHRETTPMEYLRRVRLHHARLDLLAGDRMLVTVADIAAKWGFGNMGRFAAHYRLHYGESPHQTLRR